MFHTTGIRTMAFFAAIICARASGTNQVKVAFDFTSVPLAIYKTTPTFQIVSNPLLDRQYTLANGTVIDNPIHKNAWGSVKNLKADHVRFQPWFPFPHKAVAELVAPVDGKPTSWDFSDMMPGLEDFMAATEGHPKIFNFGTIPTWMFAFANASFPADPNAVDQTYGAAAFRMFMKDQSAETLAGYYARLMSYLVKGEMTDEHGVVHSGGPKYDLSLKSGNVFEFLNEAEHRYSPANYVHDYSVVIPEIVSTLGGRANAPGFMGIGGCQNGNWAWWFMGNCSTWIPGVLDRSKYKDDGANIPMEWASIHYYQAAANRSDSSSYTRYYFGGADEWFVTMDENIRLRDQLNPKIKLAMTELGTLMVDDMSKVFGNDGGLPDDYFSVGGAFFVYVFAHMAIRQLDVICLSQLIGSPPMPEWNINGMQFPSATMLDWNTGFGNAKYWALKLLIDHVPLGSTIHNASITQLVPRAAPREVMCESIGHWTFTGQIEFTCSDPTATIEHIWADAGLPPSGQCGSYVPSKLLSTHNIITAWAYLECHGKHSCLVDKTRVPLWPGELKELALRGKVDPHSTQITLQFQCSSGEGVTSADYAEGKSVYALGFVTPSKARKMLLINKEARPVALDLQLAFASRSNATAHIVDPRSVQRGSAQGIRTEQWQIDPRSTAVTLERYAVVVADLD